MSGPFDAVCEPCAVARGSVANERGWEWRRAACTICGVVQDVAAPYDFWPWVRRYPANDRNEFSETIELLFRRFESIWNVVIPRTQRSWL